MAQYDLFGVICEPNAEIALQLIKMRWGEDFALLRNNSMAMLIKFCDEGNRLMREFIVKTLHDLFEALVTPECPQSMYTLLTVI